MSRLTVREIEVADLFCEGFVSKEVADKLNITKATAERHRENVYRATFSHNVAQLFWWMIRNKVGQTYKKISQLCS